MKKILKFILLSLIVFMIVNCGKDDEPIPEPSPPLGIPIQVYDHEIFIDLQDSSGNGFTSKDSSGYDFTDSIIGVEEGVQGEFFSLEIIFDEGIPYPWEYPNSYNTPNISLYKNNLCVLFLSFSKFYKYWLYDTGTNKIPFAEKVIFRFTCPYYFGDNEAHDIVTRWRLVENSIDPECYIVEFNGKEFPAEKRQNGFGGYAAAITLNK